MRTKFVLVLLCVVAALAICVAAFLLRPPPSNTPPPQPEPAVSAATAEPVPPPVTSEPVPPVRPRAPAPSENVVAQPPPSAPASKTEQLAQLRESFRALAVGDLRVALRTARQLTNDVERETALLALVTEWNHGELTPPRQRAWAIASLGLEAGLGKELARNPELAQVWAFELNSGQNRPVLPDRLGSAMVDSDPATAMAFSEQLSPEERRKFLQSAFAWWGHKDTEAALQRAEQMPEPAKRDAAVKAIRSSAPVGIGVELNLQDGYPAVNKLFPGTPAEQSGQLHPGDRIVAIAQSYGAFVDTRSVPMQDLVQSIRGTPGTLIQLQVVSADAPPEAPPRTIALVRGQIKFKQ